MFINMFIYVNVQKATYFQKHIQDKNVTSLKIKSSISLFNLFVFLKN